MATFKNIKSTGRVPGMSNVVACEAERAPNSDFVECDAADLEGLSPLWTQAGVRYYGHM